MDVESTQRLFETEGLSALLDFVKVPCVSPRYEPDWQAKGYIQQAVEGMKTWAEELGIPGLSTQILQICNAPPVLFCDIPGSSPSSPTICLYGHLDKQPGQVTWPAFTPVLKEGKLYGRGAADDGYAAITALIAIKACGTNRPRCVVVLETEEESGSPHFSEYLQEIRSRIGSPALIIVLDSNIPSYDRLWVTESMRGSLNFDLRVDVLEKGIHSGCSGLLPDSFRVLRCLLARIEDPKTGQIRLPALHSSISPHTYRLFATLSQHDPTWLSAFPFSGSTGPLHSDIVELRLNQAWRPAMTITGADGIPSSQKAGNVMRPYTAVRVAMRLPPDINPAEAHKAVERTVLEEVPNKAKVSIENLGLAEGWVAKAQSQRLQNAINTASISCFGTEALASAAGGTIPVLSLLSAAFPEADFLVTGVLGPGSNAHSSYECLDVQYCAKLTAAVASILKAMA